MNRDIVVIGGSAGAVSPLRETLKALPADLPASVFVVIHVAANRESVLPAILSAADSLPARHPLHGEKPEVGHIYVAPPDNHLMLEPGRISVVRGPRESGHRPAVDALFRTAAVAYGSRVIGVVLSGYQDCGTAGMMSIKARGGISVVQDPTSAEIPDMPRSVLDHSGADYSVPVAQLPSLLESLVRSPSGGSMDQNDFIRQLEGAARGSPAQIVCPSCHGVVTQSQQNGFQYFRCHVGHTFTAETLLGEQHADLDRALWSAVRALEESSTLNQRISSQLTGEMKSRLAEKAASLRYDAELIREVILHPGGRRGASTQ